jgi:hypothetical protein
MKRRDLVVQTVTGAFSATVFTAAGWLMGTRTLTMSQTEAPPDSCPGGESYCPPGSACNAMCGDFWKTCNSGGNCSSPNCRYTWTRAIGCNGGGCECACRYTFPSTTCGACTC